MKKTIFFIISLIQLVSLLAQNTEGEEFEWVISPQFEEAYSFREGLARIKIDEKYGFINKAGVVVISPYYDDATAFSEGRAAVKTGRKWQFIDKKGNNITEPLFSDAAAFQDGLALVCKDNNNCGYMDLEGNISFPKRNKHFSLFSFSEGLAKIETDRMFGYIDHSFNTVIKINYEEADNFSEGLAAVKKKGKWGYIDKYGKMAIEPRFEAAAVYSEGLAAVTINGKRGFIDKNGHIVIEPQFEAVSRFGDGVALVKVDGKIGVIDKKGNSIVTPQFEKGFVPSENLIPVMSDGLYGYIKIIRKKKEIELTKPNITWESPVSYYSAIESDRLIVKACIQSKSPVDISLNVDGKEWGKRDFIIKPISNTCDYKYEQQIEISVKNQPVTVVLSATNQAGTVTSDRVIEAKEKPHVETNVISGAEKRIALLIGNNSYPSGSLKNAINDANDLATVLKSLGFETFLYTDLNQRDLKKAIIDFGSKLSPGCTAMFFYAGHGIQAKGINYIVPTDAQLDREANVDIECVSMNSILQQMEGAQSRVNIVVLDACRNNPWERSWSRSGGQGGLTKMDAPLETLIFYATKPGSTAEDGGEGKNGLFTSELLKNISKPGLQLEQVFKSTSAGVRLRTNDKQVPWIEGTFTGEFYFTK